MSGMGEVLGEILQAAKWVFIGLLATIAVLLAVVVILTVVILT